MMFRSSNRPTALTIALALFLAAAGTASCGGPQSGAPAGEQPSMAAAAMTPLERGEYLAFISGCHDCHTPGALFGAPDFERSLSGSDVGWQGPWGVSYARNLTPDIETGLGSWTEEEIVRALQAGVRKDGSPIMPPMPWPNYARMPREDVTALAAYLKSLPAVKHAVPERAAPGRAPSGPVIQVPAPGAWDAPRKAAS